MDTTSSTTRPSHAAENAEFDFGPYKSQIVTLWRQYHSRENRYDAKAPEDEKERRELAKERILDSIVELTARTLIDSGGEIVEPHNILKASKSKGVFRAMEEAISEASKANPTYLSVNEWTKLNLAKNVAAKAVQLLLAEREVSAEPTTQEPEVTAIVDGVSAGVPKVAE